MRFPRTRLGRQLVVVGLCVLALGGWWLHHRRNSVQVPATFARLAEAFADNDASAVVGTLHPDYDWAAQWPTVFSHQDELKALLGGSTKNPELDRPRGLARAGLRQWFLQHITNRLELTWTVHQYTVGEDDTITVLADIELAASNGSVIKLAPLRRHRFVLQGYGIGPKLRILRHDPIPVTMPF